MTAMTLHCSMCCCREVRGQGITTPPGCADVTSSLAPVGVQGKTEAIAPRRRLPYPRTPRHHAPPRPRRNGLGGGPPGPAQPDPTVCVDGKRNPSSLAEGLEGGCEGFGTKARTPAVPRTDALSLFLKPKKALDYNVVTKKQYVG